MPATTLLRPLVLALALAAAAPAQFVIAATSGLPNPTQTIDFGANALPNFTPVTNQFAGLTVSHASYFTTGVSNNLVGGFLTNDSSGPPSTLRLAFAAPVTDVTFVYHQVGTPGTSTIRALLGGSPVASFSGSWNQYQPNNYFGFQNTVLDEVQIDFVIDFNVDTLAFHPLGAARCVPHNGTGVNPVDFTCTSRPVLGTTWQGVVAGTPNTVLTFLAFATGGLAAPSPLFGGELLIATNPAPIAFAGLGSYSLAVPAGNSWIGTALTFQGFRVDVVQGVSSLVPLNAQDLVFGL